MFAKEYRVSFSFQNNLSESCKRLGRFSQGKLQFLTLLHCSISGFHGPSLSLMIKFQYAAFLAVVSLNHFYVNLLQNISLCFVPWGPLCSILCRPVLFSFRLWKCTGHLLTYNSLIITTNLF